MPLVSIIIPAYNAEKTIQGTIESVLNQTITDFELIVINDGSQDSTLDIASSIQDHRIKVSSYPNAGPNHSRNRGLAQATGDYVSFLDADDLWTQDKLEAQIKALQANPEASVAYSWTNWMNEAGQFLRRGSYVSVSGNVYAKLLLVDFIESGSNPLIRKQALVEVGGFDESLLAAQDWDMWLRLAARYHFVAVPSAQVLYRVSANSWSSNICRVEKASLQVIERAFAQKEAASIQHLKKHSIANRYNGLTFKTLEGPPGRQQSLTAARFLWHAVSNEPSLLRARVILKVIFKIATMALLPPQQAQTLFKKFKNLSNINALHGYLKVDPF